MAAMILKGFKFYGYMLASSRCVNSPYMRRDYSGSGLFRQYVSRKPDFSRCLALPSTSLAAKAAAALDPTPSATPADSLPPSRVDVSAHVQALDRALHRIDQDIRRSGRVSRKDVEEVFGDVKEIGGATSMQVLMMIRCCGNLVPDEPPPVRTQLVQEIWGSLESMGIPLDVSHYNALLRVYIENEHKFSPLEFLSYMEQKGVEPNRVTYQRLITRFCQDGDIEGASKILEFMKQKELPINENVFNALILGHARANDVESAKGILSVMKQAQIEPSGETYAALLKAVAEKKDIAAMKGIFEDSQKAEVEFSDREILDIVASLAGSGYEGDYFDEVLSKLRKISGFNQEAMNVGMRLINISREDVARKILNHMERPIQTISSDESGGPFQLGGFFIRQMVKAGRPIEKTLEYINEFEREKFHTNAHAVGLHVALIYGKEKEALIIMEQMREKARQAGDPESSALRSHFFWPLLATAGQSGRMEDMFTLLRRMTDWGVAISLETVADYVLPYVRNISPYDLVDKLRAAGVGMAMSLNGVTEYLLLKHDISAAAAVSTSYGLTHLSWSYLNQPLGDAYMKNPDVQSTLTLLALLEEVPITGRGTGRSTRSNIDLYGSFCIRVLSQMPRKNMSQFELLLKGMAEAGFGISQTSSERIINMIGENLTENISLALEKMLNVEEGARPEIQGGRRRERVIRDRRVAVDMLERKLKTLPEDDVETRSRILRQILTNEIRDKNVPRVEELLRQLEGEKVNLPIGFLALLIDMYAQTEHVDKAFGLYQEFLQKDPSATMDSSKILHLANALIVQGRFDDAIQILKAHKPNDASKEKDLNLNPLCWRVLNSLAEKNEVEKIREVLNIFKDSGFAEINNVLLGPLMKAHLANDDLTKAMEAFQEAADVYRCTPWKTELTIKLINNEDTEKLQKVMDLSTKIHGEVNSLYDLVFCFLETGRTRQAKKILETPGLRAKNQRFEQICQRFLDDDRVDELENLVSITKDIFDVDRSMLYYYLLQAYAKREDTPKALGVWTTLQEEDLQPSPEFLRHLASYLERKGERVPFVVPSRDEQSMSSLGSLNITPVSATASAPAPRAPTPPVARRAPVPAESSDDGPKVSVLRRALRNGDIDEALKIKEEIEAQGGKVPVTDVSHLISSLLGKERVGEAVKLAEHMRTLSQHPLPATFKYLLARLAAAGDHAAVESLGTNLTNDLRRKVSYDNHLCSALIHAGKSDEVLSKWSEILQKDGVDTLQEIFPVGGALAMLFNTPETSAKFEKLAVEAAEKKFIAPMNMYWIWLLTSRDITRSREVLDKYLTAADGILFRSVLRKIRDSNDVELAHELYGQVNKCALSGKSKGVVLSALMDVQIASGAPDDAMGELKKALDAKVCELADVNHTALERLKGALEAGGKPFPYEMPPKKVSS